MDCPWTKLRDLAVELVQVEEIYSFVNCMQENTTVDDMLPGDQSPPRNHDGYLRSVGALRAAYFSSRAFFIMSFRRRSVLDAVVAL